MMVGCALAVLAIAAPAARGQADLARFNRQMEQVQHDRLLADDRTVPPDQRVYINYGGYASFTYVSIDDNNNDNHGLRQSDLLGYFQANWDNVNEVFFRARTTYRDFNAGDSFDDRGDDWIKPELERGYYRFDLAGYTAARTGKTVDYDIAIKGGRDLVYWGNGLTFVQAIDGVVIDMSKGPYSLEVIGGVTPMRTLDFDSSRPFFDTHTHRGFYGALGSVQIGQHRPYVYGLLQRDYNPNDGAEFGSIKTKFNYTSNYLGIGSTGAFSDQLAYGVEATYEGGKGLTTSAEPSGAFLVPVNQVHEPVSAWALDGRLDYLFHDTGHTHVGFEAIAASGDPDRQSTTNTFLGNKAGTHDQAFNGFGLLNTGLAFAPAVSNLLAFRVGASTFPLPTAPNFRRMQTGLDFFFFSKMRKNSDIDETTTFGKAFLGVEPDLFVNWQVTSDVTLAFRYGVFFPSQTTYGSFNDPRQFFSGQITYAF
jgi:hypothetical protein